MNKDIIEIQELFNEICDDSDNLSFDSDIASKAARLHNLCNQKISLIKEEILELEKTIEKLEDFKNLSNHHVDTVYRESSHFFK